MLFALGGPLCSDNHRPERGFADFRPPCFGCVEDVTYGLYEDCGVFWYVSCFGSVSVYPSADGGVEDVGEGDRCKEGWFPVPVVIVDPGVGVL